MKVSEAKTKVCPFMAEMGEDGSGFTMFHKHINCICGDCMAWQWTITNEEGDVYKHDNDEEQEGYCKRLGQ